MRKIIFIAAILLLPLPLFSQNVVEHPWKGARVAFLGDSITDPGYVPENLTGLDGRTSIIGGIFRSGLASSLWFME